MKKVLLAFRFLAVITVFTLLMFACAKSTDYNTPAADCKTCEIKNASGDHIDNVKFCSETEKSNYQAAHPTYTIDCN
jgi:hypothetical protein